jgi:hypothetical protein
MDRDFIKNAHTQLWEILHTPAHARLCIKETEDLLPSGLKAVKESNC